MARTGLGNQQQQGTVCLTFQVGFLVFVNYFIKPNEMGSIYLFCNVSDAVVFIFAQKWTESFYVSLACDKFNSDGV